MLVFYGPSTLLKSFRVRPVNVSTLHCSWASLLGSLPVLSAHSFASNLQLPFLNPRKGENSSRNYFITNLCERMLPGVRIEPATVRIPSGRALGRAIASDSRKNTYAIYYFLRLALNLRLIIPLVSFGIPRPNKKIIQYYIFEIFLMKYLTLRR